MEVQSRVEYFNFETLTKIDPLYFKSNSKNIEVSSSNAKIKKDANKKPIEKLKRTCNKCLSYIRGECRLGFKQDSGVPIEVCPKPMTNYQLNTIDEWKLNNLKQN